MRCRSSAIGRRRKAEAGGRCRAHASTWGVRLLVTGLAVAGVLSFARGAAAQSGGIQSLFTVGVGARPLGMGGAFVAYPDDPTAILWNPGALDLLERRAVTVFYTNLLAGSHYGFVGYVHPTLTLGTFAVGWARVATGELQARDEHNVAQGTFGMSQDEFLFSYSKQLPFSLTAGATVKFHRESIWNFTDSGMGVDVGVIWQPNLPEGSFSGLTVGLSVQNALSPSTRLAQQANYLPHDIRVGVSLPIGLDMLGGRGRVYLDIEKGDRAPTQLHLGTEYVYEDRAALRFGINNGQLSFGAGWVQGDFRLDYSFGRFFEHELSPSHRFSLTVGIGKTREEILQLIREREARRLEELVQKQIEWERREQIDRSLREGRQYLESGEYFRAWREFQRVLALDPQNTEAQTLSQQAEQKIDEQLTKEATEQARKDLETKLREEQEKFAREHYNKGLAFLETGDYLQALREFNMILERQPENDVAKKMIEEVHKEIDKMIEELVLEARRLLRQNNKRQAVAKLREAQRLAADRPEVVKLLQGKINSIEAQLDFSGSFEQGIRYYAQKNYKAAMKAFERALHLQPNNNEVRRWYEEAKARALAKDEPLKGEVRAKYLQGLEYFTNGEYEKALQVWEECRKLQPYNKRILDSIDEAREVLKKR